MDIISRIRYLDGKLPKREQRVADYVLGQLEQVSYSSQIEIAQASEVSVATVNRFCQKLGVEGFREFKILLVQSIAVSLQYLGGENKQEDGSHYLVNQVFGALIDSLALAKSQLDSQAMQSAMDVLAGAKRIRFMGVGGGSANVAQEGANRFFRLGIPAEAHSDGYMQRMLSATLGKDDVVFVISSSGLPAELIDSVHIARQYGVKTIGLAKAGSPLACITDITIGLDIPEDQDIYKPSVTRLVFMAVIDVLAAGTARKRPEEVKEILRRIRTSLVPLSKDTKPRPIGD